MTHYDSVHELLQNFVRKKSCLLSKSIHEKLKFSLLYKFETCNFNLSTFWHHRNNIFCFVHSLPPFSLSFSLSLHSYSSVNPKLCSFQYQLIRKIFWTSSPISIFLLWLFKFYWTRTLKPWKTDRTKYFSFCN